MERSKKGFKVKALLIEFENMSLDLEKTCCQMMKWKKIFL